MKSFFRRSRPHPPTEHTKPLSLPPTDTPTPTTNQPLTIIELFQSQGCNSCPPTNALLLPDTLPNTLLLTHHVTYWDHLGWPDTFGLQDSDTRQREYVHRLKLRSTFTPQVIVNGRASGVGNTKDGLQKVIREGTVGASAQGNLQGNLEVNLEVSQLKNDVTIHLSSPTNQHHSHRNVVYLLRYDPEVRDVHILRGENKGRVLQHRNVVRAVELVGEGEGRWAVGRGADGLEGVVVVQRGVGGQVVGVRRLE